MARRTGEPVSVNVSSQGLPVAFTRRRRYWVEVIASWRLVAYWWDGQGASDRTHYHVQSGAWELFELYYDAVLGLWVLDGCHD